MSTKNSRSGGKYSSSHTTVIPAAGTICDIVNKCPIVTRISLGFITAGLRSVSGQRRVKITEYVGVILLSVRDNTSRQEVYVYADDLQKAMVAIAKGVGDSKFHFHITFSNQAENGIR